MSDRYTDEQIEAMARKLDAQGIGEEILADMLRQLLAERRASEKERDNWTESAREAFGGIAYYQGLLDRIGDAFGPESHIADSGDDMGSVVRAKLPEMAKSQAAELAALRAESEQAVRTFDAITQEVCAAIGIEKSERPAHWVLGIRDLHRELDRLRAEKARLDAELAEAKIEVVDSHRALMASEEFRRAYTRFCTAIPEALAKDGQWPPAEKSAWEKLWLSMPISHGPLERKTREVEQAYTLADHSPDAGNMVPAPTPEESSAVHGDAIKAEIAAVLDAREEECVAELLHSFDVFVAEGPGGIAKLCVNANDVFCAAADCEDLPASAILDVYRASKTKWGVTAWLCKHVGQRPQKGIMDAMKSDGEWTDELEALPERAPAPTPTIKDSLTVAEA